MPEHEEDRLAHRAREMEVCGECGELTGRVETWDGVSREQACHCHERRTEPRWPRHDYNAAIELCHACAARPIQCGSRLSLFYCRECLRHVNDYNERATPRSYIPVGRHSMLHGMTCVVPKGFDDLVSRISVVQRWRRDRVRAVVQSLGGNNVPIDAYLARARELYDPADPVAQLAARIEELGPPPYPVRVPRWAAPQPG